MQSNGSQVVVTIEGVIQCVFQYVLFELNRVDVLLVERAYLILDIESNLKILSRRFYLVLSSWFSPDSSLIKII